MILLESDLPLDEALSSYRTQLAALDWKEHTSPEQQPGGGFVQSDYRRSVHLEFCHTPSCAWLRPTLAEREEATTLVRLVLMLGEQGNPCAHPERPEQPAPRGFLGHSRQGAHVLPALIAPPGTELQHRGSSFGPDGVHMTSEVTTQLGPEALARHYVGQLTQACWTQTNAGAGGPFGWSTWQFTSSGPEPSPWSALLFILKTPYKPDHYTLDLRASQSNTEAAQ